MIARAYVGIAMMLFTGARHHDASLADMNRSADSAWKSGDFSAAALWYERAVALAPHSPEPAYDMALVYYRQGVYRQSLRYLDIAQPMAHGELLGRCFLLRGDMEYRQAIAAGSAQQVEGLERALKLYRTALGAGGGSAAVSGIAKYDIEVVKLRLPVAKGNAPRVTSPEGSQSDASADDVGATGGKPSRRSGKSSSEERDW